MTSRSRAHIAAEVELRLVVPGTAKVPVAVDLGYDADDPFAVTAAARFSRMRAAASLYGVGMVTDAEDSPHRLLDRVQGELYLGFAGIDPAVPDHVIPALDGALKAAGTRHTLETYPGVHHGFCFANRPDYDAAAAATLARDAGANHLVLTHQWEEADPMNNAAIAREIFLGRISIASPGLTVTW